MNTNFQNGLFNESLLLFQYNSLLYSAGKEIMFIKNHEYYKGTILSVNGSGMIEILVNHKIKSFRHKEIELLFN